MNISETVNTPQNSKTCQYMALLVPSVVQFWALIGLQNGTSHHQFPRKRQRENTHHDSLSVI